MPPDGRHCFAALQTAAMTELSSVAIGTSRSRPSMIRLVAMPTGMASVAMTFSLIRSATSPTSAEVAARCSTVASDAPTVSATVFSRSATVLVCSPVTREE